ncbi:MAG: glycosyltransferase family 1 protein [Patescibacteria group bacterium]|jgi:glycosyltransferase involved in cell wall biosynthesis
MKTIGIDASALLKANPTGVENYARLLLGEMMKTPLQEGESVVLYARGEQPSDLGLPAGWTWKALPFWFPKGWTHFRLAKELFQHPVSVFFSPAHEVPLATGSAKVVTTVHDVVFAKYPKLYSPLQNIRQRAAVKHAVRVASKILTVSANTKRDLMSLFKASEEKIIVTHLASSIEPRSVETKAGEKYFLYIGRIEEKKNVGLLVEAFRQFKELMPAGDTTKLVLVGGIGYGGERILGAAQGFGDAKPLHLGYVPNEEIPGLYAGAIAFVFPSHDEGFGLPILDAMKMGTPTLVSDIPVFHEVAGSAAEYASPNDATAFAVKMKALVENPALRSSLSLRGMAQAEKYSWTDTARLTWHALRSV